MATKTALAVGSVVLALVASACAPPITDAVAAGEIDDLPSVEALAADFNEHRGEPRLILLLSPT